MHTPTLAIRRTPLVAVCGTLKRGLRNHHWLEGAEFIGCDSLTTATLYDIGPYPGARAEPSQGVDIEVFRVDAHCLSDLDELEDYREQQPKSGEYDRAIHATAFGPAWLYLYNLDVTGCSVIRAGGWPITA